MILPRVLMLSMGFLAAYGEQEVGLSGLKKYVDEQEVSWIQRLLDRPAEWSRMCVRCSNSESVVIQRPMLTVLPRCSPAIRHLSIAFLATTRDRSLRITSPLASRLHSHLVLPFSPRLSLATLKGSLRRHTPQCTRRLYHRQASTADSSATEQYYGLYCRLWVSR